MKKVTYILLFFLSVFAACTKPEPIRTSGIDTIDNTIYKTSGYFAYGFSFDKANLITTNANPGPDLILFINTDNLVSRLTFQVNSLNPSFYKSGDYADEAAAMAAFDNLKTVSVTQWLDMADPILPNQVWIYRSGGDKYAKIRIISTKNEMRLNIPYGECTFQWVYQTDGSLTFPAK